MPTEKEEKKVSVSPIHFLAQFREPEPEKQFRQHDLKNEKVQLLVAICVFIIPNLVFAYSDYILFDFSRRFYTIITVRGVHLLLAITLLIVVPRIREHLTFDITALIFWTSLIALVFFINTTRPPEYVHHSVIDILVLFTIYVLVSNRLVCQVLPALLFSMVNILYIAAVKTDMSTMAFNVLWVSYLVGNILGIFVSRRLNFSRRLQFAALQEETRLREKLEKALSEVKTLRGIIPICSNCKKIRDDDGFWQRVEIYVRKHSEADFTHSLCPECAETLYPFLKGKERQKKNSS